MPGSNLFTYTLLVLTCLLIHTCTEPETAKLGEAFALRFGQSIDVEGEPLSLKFIDVVGDSRCPTGVVCVWEGNAEVALLANADTLNLNTTLDPKSDSVDGYVITLLTVTPYPSVDEPILKSRYSIEMLVTK